MPWFPNWGHSEKQYSQNAMVFETWNASLRKGTRVGKLVNNVKIPPFSLGSRKDAVLGHIQNCPRASTASQVEFRPNIVILKGLPRWIKKKMVDLLSRSLPLSTENLATPGGKFKIGNFILHLQLQQPSNQKLKTYYWHSNSMSNYAHFETNILSLFALSTNFEIGGTKWNWPSF